MVFSACLFVFCLGPCRQGTHFERAASRASTGGVQCGFGTGGLNGHASLFFLGGMEKYGSFVYYTVLLLRSLDSTNSASDTLWSVCTIISRARTKAG